MHKVAEYLNKTVFCRISPSKINGVGVFAIRDIPKGQELTDYYGQAFPSYRITREEFNQILPEIRHLIKQQTIFRENDIWFDSPNSHQLMEVYMNHSDTPNSDGKIAIKDIAKGEEVTKDYNIFINESDELTKDILKI